MDSHRSNFKSCENSYFLPGIINTTTGTVTDITGGIAGDGNVSTSGIFAVVNATALGPGISDIGPESVQINGCSGFDRDPSVRNASVCINNATGNGGQVELILAGSMGINDSCQRWDVNEDGIVNRVDIMRDSE